jgi:hypothetical protein
MTPPPDPTKIPGPICQFCDVELPTVGFYQWVHGIFMILCVYCPNCQRIISAQTIPNLEMLQAPEDPRIHIAH